MKPAPLSVAWLSLWCPGSLHKAPTLSSPSMPSNLLFLPKSLLCITLSEMSGSKEKTLISLRFFPFPDQQDSQTFPCLLTASSMRPYPELLSHHVYTRGEHSWGCVYEGDWFLPNKLGIFDKGPWHLIWKNDPYESHHPHVVKRELISQGDGIYLDRGRLIRQMKGTYSNQSSFWLLSLLCYCKRQGSPETQNQSKELAQAMTKAGKFPNLQGKSVSWRLRLGGSVFPVGVWRPGNQESQWCGSCLRAGPLET